MNLGTFVVGLLVILAVLWCLYTMRQDKKKGKSCGCGGSCSSCGGCPSKTNVKK